MRNSFLSMILFLVFFILFQYALQYVLVMLGFSGVWLYIMFDFILAFAFAYFQYPSVYRKEAFKNPRFHMSVAIYFALLVGLDLLFRL
ncbi:MAG: hypothetical protein SO253_04185 [Bacilli bacterium]|nr:hypothetical protein [Bacilli bacterium]